jgi:hypothetical protein
VTGLKAVAHIMMRLTQLNGKRHLKVESQRAPPPRTDHNAIRLCGILEKKEVLLLMIEHDVKIVPIRSSLCSLTEFEVRHVEFEI